MKLFFSGTWLGIILGFGLAYLERSYIHGPQEVELLKSCQLASRVATSCCNSAAISAQTAQEVVQSVFTARSVLIGER